MKTCNHCDADLTKTEADRGAGVCDECVAAGRVDAFGNPIKRDDEGHPVDPRKEAWEIEVGNEATVTETINYEGSALGATRAANRRWNRRRRGRETVLVLRRPGCRPYKLITDEE